jgi:hypothetical protein
LTEKLDTTERLTKVWKYLQVVGEPKPKKTSQAKKDPLVVIRPAHVKCSAKTEQ